MLRKPMKLEETVLSIIEANTEGKGQVTLASDLRHELHLDSFGTLMLINAIEDDLGVTVNEDDFCQVRTVGDVVALLRTKYQRQ